MVSEKREGGRGGEEREGVGIELVMIEEYVKTYR